MNIARYLTILVFLFIVYAYIKFKNDINIVEIEYIDSAIMKTRTDVVSQLNHFKFQIMIEIGVGNGDFALNVLNNWETFIKYYGIDPWKHQDNYNDASNVSDKEQEEIHEEAVKKLKNFGNRVEFIRQNSKDAVNMFEDESIDFIYLDSRYDYCSVWKNLILYYPKLKCGGLFGGNNFLSVVEQFLIKSDHDYSICANGQKVLKSGGSVKGKISFCFI
jgi:hypothetical protein